MLVGVVLCLLARVPEQLAREDEEYDPYDFYGNSVEETAVPSTAFQDEGRMKRNKGAEDMRSHYENIDEKAETDNLLVRPLRTESQESLEKQSTHKEYTDIYEYIDRTDNTQDWQTVDNGDTTLQGYLTEVTRQNWKPYTAQKWQPVAKDATPATADAATIQQQTPTIDVMLRNTDVLQPSTLETIYQSHTTDCVERWKHIWPDGGSPDSTNVNKWGTHVHRIPNKWLANHVIQENVLRVPTVFLATLMHIVFDKCVNLSLHLWKKTYNIKHSARTNKRRVAGETSREWLIPIPIYKITIRYSPLLDYGVYHLIFMTFIWVGS
ncbi:hypothetical protein SFRURICE_016051 [Spodoptera frugiperda]|nr:hypothetical protein SFRURICE_016051 [Spodoptera frugiperda]